jgi:hypothetical protein
MTFSTKQEHYSVALVSRNMDEFICEFIGSDSRGSAEELTFKTKEEAVKHGKSKADVVVIA